MAQCNNNNLKPIFSACFSLLLVLVIDTVIQIKFYNFALNFIYKFILYFGCVKLIDYLFSIKDHKFYAIKLLCCGLAVFLFDRPMIRTIDILNQRYHDFTGVENIENGWMYTSMIKFNKSALFPIIESSIIYAVEVSKSEPVFLEYECNELTQHKYKDGILIEYCIDKNNILFNYSMSDYNYYGYIDTEK